ncbi:unnamed protein product [Blepharisma stoltei]|uniref:O-methyltransferase C-terminal domain-containing protein n=1 Tax=Blepharisma stoltei TaxID=1481888 RepID=A0AAU9KK72_9CILI|nr:unnamed protein product [Blepharisma stoltei]
MEPKQPDESNKFKDEIYYLAMSPLIAMALNSTLAFNIPKLLENPKTIDELAQQTSAVKGKLERTLLALEAFGYYSFDEQSQKWSNSGKTVLFLDQAFRDAIYFCCVPFQYEILLRFADALQCDRSSCELQTGRNIYDELAHRNLDNNYFQTGLGAYTKMSGDSLFNSIDLKNSIRILDAGGGDGTLLCELAKRNSNIQGTVLDMASISEIATKNIESYGLQEKITFLGGDFREEVPSGYDCIIFKQTLNSWTDEVASRILENCYRSLESGKKLIIIEHVLVKTDENYREVRYLDLIDISEIEAKVRNMEEFRRIIEYPGFVIDNVKKIPGQYIFEATKP